MKQLQKTNREIHEALCYAEHARYIEYICSEQEQWRLLQARRELHRNLASSCEVR